MHNNLECTEERQFETRFENLLKMIILNFEFDFKWKNIRHWYKVFYCFIYKYGDFLINEISCWQFHKFSKSKLRTHILYSMFYRKSFAIFREIKSPHCQLCIGSMNKNIVLSIKFSTCENFSTIFFEFDRSVIASEKFLSI